MASRKSKQPRKDPEGGLTSEGRKYFRRKEAAHLKPGVTGPADTPTKQRRKGSFLRRHYAHLRGPLTDDKGEPTRLALAAHAWGEIVPKTRRAAARLAKKGSALLEKYRRSKQGKTAEKTATTKTTKAKTTKTRTTKAKKTATRKASTRKASAKRRSSQKRQQRT